MTDLRQAAMQALEALESGLAFDAHSAVLQNLRAALEQPEQEPVAWRVWSPDGTNVYQYTEDGDGEPLYTTPPAAQPEPPPEWDAINNIIAEYGLDAIAFVSEWKAAQRPWVGLEAEDLAQIDTDEFWQVGNHMAIATAVEAKLKERNT